MKLVTLDALKLALGIDEDDESEDESLEAIEGRVAAFVEAQTGRRFQTAETRVEYKEGSGTRTLYLSGHIEPSDTEDDVLVAIRDRPLSGGAWSDVDAEDFELRAAGTLVRLDGSVWRADYEYELTYEDGYAEAPADIQALVIELIGLERSNASGDAGLVSEQIGPYKYTLDTTAAAASLSVTDSARATLNRWRRIPV